MNLLAGMAPRCIPLNYADEENGLRLQPLEIKGTITGAGALKTDGITIKLVKKDNGLFTFFFKLDEGNLLTTEVGGGVLESRGS